MKTRKYAVLLLTLLLAIVPMLAACGSSQSGGMPDFSSMSGGGMPDFSSMPSGGSFSGGSGSGGGSSRPSGSRGQ